MLSQKILSKKMLSKKTLRPRTDTKHGTSKLAACKTLPPHHRRCIIIKDPKHRGEWTELNFMSRVTERGFNVSKPWGDSARYDVAVERGGMAISSSFDTFRLRDLVVYFCARANVALTTPP